jgi:hypothetical protein
MTVDLKHLTFQQSLDLPEMKARYSIVAGELVMAAARTTEHPRMITSKTTGRFIASETNNGYLQRDIGGRPILSTKSGHTQ